MDIRNFVLSYYQNSTDDFHMQKVEYTVEARKPHTHAYFQIGFVISGTLRHVADDETALLTRGDMFIIPPGTTHYLTPEPETVFYSLSFMPGFIGAFVEASDLALHFLRDLRGGKHAVPPRITLSPEDVFRVEEMLAQTLREFDTKPLGYAEVIRAYTALLVTILARAGFVTREPTSLAGGERFVIHCVEYVKSHYAEALSLDAAILSIAISISAASGTRRNT